MKVTLYFVFYTGDLTDAKLADLRGSMQHMEEWSDYQRVLQSSGVLDKTVWFDIRGNHGNAINSFMYNTKYKINLASFV